MEVTAPLEAAQQALHPGLLQATALALLWRRSTT